MTHPTRPIQLERYNAQALRWPASGRHVLASFSHDSVVVYQAYRSSIASWAVANQQLGGPDFSFNRMSWIKPSFLWMMYRSAWGTSENQSHVLGLRITRTFFDRLLRTAVPSTFLPEVFPSRADWERAVRKSDVRLQWDPDHLPSGKRTARRALQLGLRREVLAAFASQELLEVIDMSATVLRGRNALAVSGTESLETPAEFVYVPPEDAAANVHLDPNPAGAAELR